MLWSSNLEVLLLSPRATKAEKSGPQCAFRKFWAGFIWNYEYVSLDPLHVEDNQVIVVFYPAPPTPFVYESVCRGGVWVRG